MELGCPLFSVARRKASARSFFWRVEVRNEFSATRP